MTPQQIAEKLGLTFPKQEPGYLNLCIQTGNLLFTSGHVSDLKGKLGQGVTVEQGYQAARDCVVKILRSVYSAHGTLDGLRVIKLLGCVNSTLEFHEQHLVINGASDLRPMRLSKSKQSSRFCEIDRAVSLRTGISSGICHTASHDFPSSECERTAGRVRCDQSPGLAIFHRRFFARSLAFCRMERSRSVRLSDPES